MTYCLGMNLDAGLVFASDTRTNAGVDNIARFGKMRTFAVAGERVLVVLSAGNLSVTQGALSTLEQRHRLDPTQSSLWNVPSLFDVAGLIGGAMREVQRRDGDYMREHKIEASASFMVGGQIRGEDPRLFLVYTEGNFIESSAATSYFQIGEIKYGKPIIDRVLHRGTSLADAVKLTMISFDSTMRSNVSVGTPIDLVVYHANSFAVPEIVHVEDSHPYLAAERASWNRGLRKLFEDIPRPDWVTE